MRKNKKHLAQIAKMSCALCAHLGLRQSGRTYIHHIRTGQGASQRADDFLTIPLCYDCHQGTQGIHGDRTLWKVGKVDELDLLAKTIQRLEEVKHD